MTMYIEIPVYDKSKDVLYDNQSFKTNNIFLSLIGGFRLTGEGLQTLTYTMHSWPLSSEGSFACHTYRGGHLFIMVISEDPRNTPVV